MGEPNAVAFDTHNSKVFRAKGTGAQKAVLDQLGAHVGLNARAMQAAEKLGMTPAALGEAKWSVIVALNAILSKTKLSPREAVQKLTHEVVRQAWDFLHILETNPNVRNEFNKLSEKLGGSRIDEALAGGEGPLARLPNTQLTGPAVRPGDVGVLEGVAGRIPRSAGSRGIIGSINIDAGGELPRGNPPSLFQRVRVSQQLRDQITNDLADAVNNGKLKFDDAVEATLDPINMKRVGVDGAVKAGLKLIENDLLKTYRERLGGVQSNKVTAEEAEALAELTGAGPAGMEAMAETGKVSKHLAVKALVIRKIHAKLDPGA